MIDFDACSPGEHPHSDRANFDLMDYLQMCRDGEAQFSISEAARMTGHSRAFLYRCIMMASIPEDEFEDVLSDVLAKGRFTTTAVADEIKRRSGRAKSYVENCPHCGGHLRSRRR